MYKQILTLVIACLVVWLILKAIDPFTTVSVPFVDDIHTMPPPTPPAVLYEQDPDITIPKNSDFENITGRIAN
jgi:hypothetical protein